MGASKQLRRKLQFKLVQQIAAFMDRRTADRSSRDIIEFSTHLGRTLAKFNPLWTYRLQRDLTRIFGDRGLDIAVQVAEQQLGRVLVDSSLVWKDIVRNPMPHPIRFSGLEHLRRSYEQGKGALIITGHYGTWELLPQATIREGFRYTCIQRQHVNREINDWLTTRRSHNGCEVIDFHRRISSNLRDSLTALQNGRILGMAADVVNKRRNFMVDFLGKKFPAPPGPSFLAFHSGAPVHTCFCERDESGYTIVVDPALDWPDGERSKKSYGRFTQMMFSRLEDRILEHPDMYTWYMRRWTELPWNDDSLRVARAKLNI